MRKESFDKMRKKTYYDNIEDFLCEFPEHEHSTYIQEKYQQLIDSTGYNKILYIEQLLEQEMIQTFETEEIKAKAITKITKQEIFDLVSNLAFLSGFVTGIKETLKKI